MGLTPPMNSPLIGHDTMSFGNGEMNRIDDGNIQLPKDGGENWTKVSVNLKAVPEGAWVLQIHASAYNEAEAYVVINDYRRDNWTP